MKIEKISENFTPLHEGILFGIDTECEEPTDIEVKIIEMATGEVVATKLLRNTVATTINIAPYVEILTEYAPSTHRQTTFTEAPTASYKICVGDIESEEVVVSVNRCKIGSAPTIVASLPTTRHIARGENDEVLIRAECGKSIRAEIAANTGESLHLEFQTASGMAILTLSTDDFETAISSLDIALYCDGEMFGSLHYAVKPYLKTATRLAWLSDSGAIERYSFPSSYKAKRYAKKRVISTIDGVEASQSHAKQFISLCSRIEPRATVEAVAQLASSPKVWVEQDDRWQLVEVVTPEIEYNLFGEPSFLHLDVCLWQKEVGL